MDREARVRSRKHIRKILTTSDLGRPDLVKVDVSERVPESGPDGLPPVDKQLGSIRPSNTQSDETLETGVSVNTGLWVITPTISGRVAQFNHCMSHILEQLKDGDYMVAVAADRESFKTVKDAADQHPNVKGVLLGKAFVNKAERAGIELVPEDAIVVEIDDHDYLMPGALERMREPFSDPDVGVVYGNYIPIDSEGGSMGPVTDKPAYIAGAMRKCCMTRGVRAYRKKLYTSYGGWYEEDEPGGDLANAIRWEDKGVKFYRIPGEPLAHVTSDVTSQDDVRRKKKCTDYVKGKYSKERPDSVGAEIVEDLIVDEVEVLIGPPEPAVAITGMQPSKVKKDRRVTKFRSSPADKIVVIEPVAAARPQKFDKPPKVSVIIPTYNREKLLPVAVSSVLMQDYPDFEVIIVDDGSEDGTPKVARELCADDDRIRYVRKENGNTATALNRGIKEAEGRYVCWLSDDDKYVNGDKLKMQIAEFEKDADLRLVFSEFYIESEGVSRHARVPKFSYQEYAYQHHMEQQCLINGSTAMLDKRAFKEIGLFNPGYRYCQDTDMWARALAHIKVKCIHQPLVSNLQHPGNLGWEYQEPKNDAERWNREVFEKEKTMLAKHTQMFASHPTICAMICMKNEGDNIERCLDDLVQWVDKIVIFNDGSTDESPALAKKYPKVVEMYDSPPKGNVRTEGQDRRKLLEMAMATGCDWLLFIDADEVFDNVMKWSVYDQVTDERFNLYYAQEVNLWRSDTKFRSDGLWCGWFPRLFRNSPGLSMGDADEHCGGVPNNIPGATMFPSGNSPKGRKINAQVLHYSFVRWEDTVRKYMLLMERDPEHTGENGNLSGGAGYYDRIIDETGLVLTEYPGNSVADHMKRKNI